MFPSLAAVCGGKKIPVDKKGKMERQCLWYKKQTLPRKHFSHEETKYISLELLPPLCHLIRVMETSFLMLNLPPLLTSSVFFSQPGGALTINRSLTDELVMQPTTGRDWHTLRVEQLTLKMALLLLLRYICKQHFRATGSPAVESEH